MGNGAQLKLITYKRSKTKYKTRETNDDEEDAGGLITRRMQNPSKTQNLKQKLNQEK